MTIWLGISLLAACVGWFVVEKGRRRSHPVTAGLQQDISLPHDTDVELYSNAFSHCSRKVRLAFAELNIPHKHHQIDLIETGWYQTISPAYLKINPSGLVPTLVHQGHPVYESDDILTYAQTLADTDAPNLYPSAPDKRAEVDKWLAFCALDSANPFAGMSERAGACIAPLTLPLFITSIKYIRYRRILIGFLFHPDKKRPALFTAGKLFGLRLIGRDPAQELLRPAREHMPRHLRTINQALEGSEGPWLTGTNYSLADITVGCLLLRLDETGWLAQFSARQPMQALLDYYNRLKQRTSWQKAIDDETHPLIDRAVNDLRQATASDEALARVIYGS